MRRWLRKKIHTLGVTPVGLRPPSVTPSVTLNNNFSNLFIDISNELLILTFLMSYYNVLKHSKLLVIKSVRQVTLTVFD